MITAKLIGNTENATLLYVDNMFYATQGFLFNWPSNWITTEEVKIPINYKSKGDNVQVSKNLILYGENDVMILMPKGILASKTKRRKTLRSLANSQEYYEFIESLMVSFWMNDIITHQLPQLNGSLISQCIIVHQQNYDINTTKKSIRSIRKSAYQIRSILDTKKFLSGSAEPDRNPELKTHIYTTINMCLETLDDELKKNNVDYTIGVCFLDWNIPIKDSECFFLNLFVNAAKYTKPDSTISVDFNELLSGIEIKITMLSSIIGEDETDKIFSLGYRGRHGKMAHRNGNGIGLYISKKISDLYGFKLSVIPGRKYTEDDHAINMFRVFIAWEDIDRSRQLQRNSLTTR